MICVNNLCPRSHKDYDFYRCFSEWKKKKKKFKVIGEKYKFKFAQLDIMYANWLGLIVRVTCKMCRQSLWVEVFCCSLQRFTITVAMNTNRNPNKTSGSLIVCNISDEMILQMKRENFFKIFEKHFVNSIKYSMQ